MASSCLQCQIYPFLSGVSAWWYQKISQVFSESDRDLNILLKVTIQNVASFAWWKREKSWSKPMPEAKASSLLSLLYKSYQSFSSFFTQAVKSIIHFVAFLWEKQRCAVKGLFRHLPDNTDSRRDDTNWSWWSLCWWSCLLVSAIKQHQ